MITFYIDCVNLSIPKCAFRAAAKSSVFQLRQEEKMKEILWKDHFKAVTFASFMSAELLEVQE